MRNFCLINCVLFGYITLLTGCTSHLTKPEQFSGFLDDYSQLQEVNSSTGKPILRWIDPNFRLSEYNNIIIQPITYYPAPKLTIQVDQNLLEDVLNYTNTQLKKSMGQHLSLDGKTKPNTLLFRGSITAVNTSNESMQFYEVLPFAMLLAGGEIITGHRTQDTNIFFEGEVIDVTTQKPVIRIVRKGMGKQVKNSNSKISFQMLKPVIDQVAEDAKIFVQPNS
ncbi:DUF3313 domain-containing protein (plasmid) [Enterobacter sp. RHB15-C17]|jgi:hypothetical protein|nr:DUF3313 domain-containing protein [Enterobacter sp. RHB15-C17]